MCRTCVHLLPHFGQRSAIPRRVHSSCAALSPSSALRSRAVIVFRLRFPPFFGSICTPCAIVLPQSHTYMRHSTLLRKRPFAFPIPCGIDRSSRNVRQPTAERFLPSHPCLLLQVLSVFEGHSILQQSCFRQFLFSFPSLIFTGPSSHLNSP